LIPIRACLIPKSALPDLEILVLEALSSVCLFCVFFLFFIISRVCDSQRFVRGFFALSCFCAAAADLINVLFREALKICHLFPIESGFCVSSIVARLVIASPPLSRTNCFYFFLDEGRGKGSSWWTWSSWQSDRLSLDLLPLRCGCPKQFGNCYLEASVEFENRSILTAEHNPIWNFQHDFI